MVTVVEENRDDENYEPLRKNLARLKAMKVGGRALDIITLPMPNKIMREGLRLPADVRKFLYRKYLRPCANVRRSR